MKKCYLYKLQRLQLLFGEADRKSRVFGYLFSMTSCISLCLLL